MTGRNVEIEEWWQHIFSYLFTLVLGLAIGYAAWRVTEDGWAVLLVVVVWWSVRSSVTVNRFKVARIDDRLDKIDKCLGQIDQRDLVRFSNDYRAVYESDRFTYGLGRDR